MKLIILGNGFDMHHNLKTSFDDFKKYCATEEPVLYNNINKIIPTSNNSWSDVERIMHGYYIDLEKKERELFEETIIEFTLIFSNYLQTYIMPTISDLKKDLNIKEVFEGDHLILSFNYTDTHKLYSDSECIHIHGTVYEDSLYPVIGYYTGASPAYNYDSYKIRYNRNHLCKSAVYYRTNGIDLSEIIEALQSQWENKIDEVVSIGFSYGKSDSHIFEILASILNCYNGDNDIPIFGDPKIKYEIFDYSDEYDEIVPNIKENLLKLKVRCDINVTLGIKPKEIEIIKFNKKSYTNLYDEKAI